MICNYHSLRKTRRAGISGAVLTKLDLAVAAAMLAILAAWIGYARTGERARTSRCAHNLKALGQAMQSFADDNDSGLPPARIEQPFVKWDPEQNQTTWNMLLRAYLRPDLVASNSPYADRQLERATAVRFFCPSDPFLRAEPRSYAMSRHDMKPENWPPGPHNTTGPGLQWSKGAMLEFLGPDAAAIAATNFTHLSLAKLSWMPAPANTLLLGERIQPGNTLADPKMVGIGGALEQTAPFKGDTHRIHRGEFNYLMTDGHVERMPPLRTGNAAGAGGIWTIEPGD